MDYAADDLFEMVRDVKTYPQFIPWISEIIVKHDSFDGICHRCDAEVHVGFKFLNERFSTRILSDISAKTISIELLNGPFNYLKSNWLFSDKSVSNPPSTQISFDIEFEFKNPFLNAIARANLDKAVARLMVVFEQRAHQILKSKQKGA